MPVKEMINGRDYIIRYELRLLILTVGVIFLFPFLPLNSSAESRVKGNVDSLNLLTFKKINLTKGRTIKSLMVKGEKVVRPVISDYGWKMEHSIHNLSTDCRVSFQNLSCSPPPPK